MSNIISTSNAKQGEKKTVNKDVAIFCSSVNNTTNTINGLEDEVAVHYKQICNGYMKYKPKELCVAHRDLSA